MTPAFEQCDLWGLLPGAAGGRVLRDRRGDGCMPPVAQAQQPIGGG